VTDWGQNVAVSQATTDRRSEIYQRMLEITDDGLLNPLWRAAGA